MLADVTEVLYKLEINIEKVKISTTPDGKVMDLFFVTDTRYLKCKSKKEILDIPRMFMLGVFCFCSCQRAFRDGEEAG